MITFLLRHFARLPIAAPRTIVVVSLGLTLLFALALPRLHVSTDRNLLAGKDNAAFVRRERVNELFGTSLVSVVVLKGNQADPSDLEGARDGLRKAADELAASLKTHPKLVRDVFYKADLAFFERHALLFLPKKTAIELPKILNDAKPVIERLNGAADFPSLIAGLSDYLENMPAADEPSEAEQAAFFGFFEKVFDDIERWFKDPAATRLEVEHAVFANLSSFSGTSANRGYLSDNDGKSPPIAVLFVQPEKNSQDMAVVSELTDVLREETRRVAAKYPGVTGEVTGMPSLITDEMRAVTRDCIVAGIFSGLGVLLVFMVAFRSIRVSLFLVAPLGVGLIWASGFTALVYGHLTLITSYFAAVLFGLGVAFTIHIVARFHEALLSGMDKAAAVTTALVSAGPGVVVGGGTTALAFFAIAISEFKGFAEMGVISGVGVTFILIANLTLLPAALILWHPGAGAVRRPRIGSVKWQRLIRVPVFSVVAALTAIAGIFASLFIEFDYAVESLLPQNAESVRGLATMERRTDFSMNYSIALADDLEAAASLRERFEKKPTVARAESITMFIPDSQAERLAALLSVSPDVTKLIDDTQDALVERLPSLMGNKQALRDAFEGFGDTLEDLSFDAKRAGLSVAKPLTNLAAKSRKLAHTIDAIGSDKRALELARYVFKGLHQGLKTLSTALKDKGFEIQDLPLEIRRRYQSIDGAHFAVLVFPAGDIGEKDFFVKHVSEVLSVTKEATGHPVTHLVFTEMVHDGFRGAVILSAIAVILLVLLDLRSIRGLLLTLLPVLMGLGFTSLIMVLTGFRFNYANLMSLPILIGTGVDYGAHLAHRAKQEGSVTAAVKTTGRAIALTGLTTLIGFGSLLLGQHFGVRSLGLILVMGILFSLISALIIVPGFVHLWSKPSKPYPF